MASRFLRTLLDRASHAFGARHPGAIAAGRPLIEGVALLKNLNFEVEAMSMSEGKPFANIMLIYRVLCKENSR